MSASNIYSLDRYKRPVLSAPGAAEALLLHSCCAPCAGEIIMAIQASGIRQTVFFYNPNIHPLEEYEMRKKENKRFCDKLGIPFVDADYDTDVWFERVKGLEGEPERGERCTVCFDMRFERTALYAHERRIPLISSTLGISRWKNMAQINASGERAAGRYRGVEYWTINWRKQGGSQRMIELSKQEHFYQQEYCGCVYSLRDTNRHRLACGRPRIKRLAQFYGEGEQLIARSDE
ncbi:epoxyqueuosine reductase QueH [Kistimonas asteriae]|uniref:epoxyqueuosine reductase QueH n=1 Tax=Kistimonas asteriae TaxID=517724 RepID=UPI001BADF6A9|nr:epoxyqueuosine reductase QueH [Kistimonas asteriae]